MPIAKICTLLTLVLLPVLSTATTFEDDFETGDKSKSNAGGFSWDPNATLTDIYNDNDSYSGSYSMRLSYPAGTAWAEQRFNTGGPYLELWVSYWIRVPTNFTYTTNGNINKFLAVWSDGYSQHGDGSTVWLLMHRQGDGGASLSFSYSDGGNTTSGPVNQTVPFITTNDRGR